MGRTTRRVEFQCSRKVLLSLSSLFQPPMCHPSNKVSPGMPTILSNCSISISDGFGILRDSHIGFRSSVQNFLVVRMICEKIGVEQH